MNLTHISDVSDYKSLGTDFPDNFYCKLASRLGPILSDKKKKSTEGSGTYEWKILGNDVSLRYPNLALTINGTSIPAEGKGIEFLKSAILGSFASEAKGLQISRPEGHDRSTDRLDLNKTPLKSLVPQIPYASGSQDLSTMRKGTASRKNFLSAEDYATYHPAGFDKHSNSECTYYTKHNINVIDITGTPASRAMFAINNPGQPKSAELLARTCPELGDMLTNPSPTNPYYVIVSGPEAFNVEMSLATKEPKVSNINVSHDLVSDIPVAPRVDPVALQFQNWCAETHHSISEKSFNIFKSEFPKLFDSCSNLV